MLCACLLLPGCLVWSIQPLVDKEHIVYDNALLGTWTSKNCSRHKCFNCTDEEIRVDFCTLEIIERKIGTAPRDGYLIILTDANGYKEEIKGKLIDLGGQLFLDTALGDDEAYIAPIANLPIPYLIPMHIFWKISLGQDNISITPLSEEWLEKEAPIMGTADLDSGDGFILTAPRSQIQELLRENANNPKAFGERHMAVWNRLQIGKESKRSGAEHLLKMKGNVERIKRTLDLMVEQEERAEPEPVEGKK